MKVLLGVICFLPAICFGNELDLPPGWILNLIMRFIQGNPTITQIVFVIGLLRLLIKPVMTIIGEFVRFTPSPTDDEWYDKIINSKIYLTIIYLLDWFASIKLPRK